DERGVAEVEVVPGDVHVPVERARGVVVDGHRLTVVVAAAVDARPDRPARAVRRRPAAEAEATATAGELACDELSELLVVDDDRVAEVVAMSGAERIHSRPRGPAVRRDGGARVIG